MYAVGEAPAVFYTQMAQLAFLKKELSGLQDCFLLLEVEEYPDPSWFGFPLTCKEETDRIHIVYFPKKEIFRLICCFPGICLDIPALMK